MRVFLLVFVGWFDDVPTIEYAFKLLNARLCEKKRMLLSNKEDNSALDVEATFSLFHCWLIPFDSSELQMPRWVWLYCPVIAPGRQYDEEK